MRLRRVCLCLIALVVIGCEPPPSSRRSPDSPSASASKSATIPTRTQAPAASVSPYLPVDPPASPSDVAGVRTNALGGLSGNWIFAANQVYEPRRELQIWAVPITGGIAKLAFAYDLDDGRDCGALIDNAPYLRRQFAPDGRRMVVSVKCELVVVDLESGRARALGVVGRFPSWSRDGTRIAFLVPVAGERGMAVGIVAVDGGPVRRLAVTTTIHQSVEWSVDGAYVVVPRPDDVVLVDAASGTVARTLSLVPGPAPSFAHWRGESPQLAIAIFGCAAPRRLVSLDGTDSPMRTLVEDQATGERCLVVLDPRWNPAADELLYLAAPMNGSCCPAHVLDIASGYDATVPVNAQEATWSADGNQIVYIPKAFGAVYGMDVRAWFRDGRRERSIILGKGSDQLVSIASVSY